MASKYHIDFFATLISVLFLNTVSLTTTLLAETQSLSQNRTETTALLQEAQMDLEQISSASDSQIKKPYPSTEYPGYISEHDGDLWSIFLKLASGLSVVVLLVLLSYKIFKNSSLAKKIGANNHSLVQVTERTYLGSKTAIFLVEINGSTFALGVTDHAVSKIGEWKTNEIDIPAKPISTGFVSQFKSMLNSDMDGAK